MEYTYPILRKAGIQLAQSLRPDLAEFNLKVASWETGGIYEILEMTWPEGMEIPSHMHQKGIETFYILEGTGEVVVSGNKFDVGPGDVIHTMKYITHYFKFSKGMKILGLFTGAAYFTKEGGWILHREYLDSVGYEPDKAFLTDAHMHEFPNPVGNSNYHYLRRKNEQLESFVEEGCTYNLKVPACETDGNGEIWEVAWEKGAQIEMHRHNHSFETLYVTGGSLEVSDGKEIYIAEIGDCIHTRPYISHSIKCLSEDTTTLNLMINKDPRS